jgi:dihydrofolate reductase
VVEGQDIQGAMAKLIYASNMSLDGYTEDDTGAFDWAELDEAVFAFTTDLMRSAGTYLYGRRMYDTMAVWETDASLAARSNLMSAFASVWRAADKVVYSTSMSTVPTARTRLERRFDPGAVRDLLASARRDVLVGGPNLAAQALEAGLVDECHLIVWPVILGGRNPALRTHGRIDLALLDEHRFANGVVDLRYRVRSS